MLPGVEEGLDQGELGDTCCAAVLDEVLPVREGVSSPEDFDFQEAILGWGGEDAGDGFVGCEGVAPF